jgi:diguanylate cyclase (GGDEF)-like protein
VGRFGHRIGRRHTVATCQQQLRPTDLFGRLGSEEFGILLRGCSRERGIEVANRIRMAISATPMHHADFAVSVYASVGLAAVDISGYDRKRLCMEADAALYRAKRGGRNRVITDAETDSVAEPTEPAGHGQSQQKAAIT